MKTKSRFLLIATAACTVVALFGWRYFAARRQLSISSIFGGEANVRIIAAPDRVQAWRSAGFLKYGERSEPDPYYLKAGEAVTVSASLAKELSSRLLNSSTYWFHPNSVKACAPTPGFILTFT